MSWHRKFVGGVLSGAVLLGLGGVAQAANAKKGSASTEKVSASTGHLSSGWTVGLNASSVTSKDTVTITTNVGTSSGSIPAVSSMVSTLTAGYLWRWESGFNLGLSLGIDLGKSTVCKSPDCKPDASLEPGVQIRFDPGYAFDFADIYLTLQRVTAPKDYYWSGVDLNNSEKQMSGSAFGLGVRYFVTPNLFIKTEYVSGKLEQGASACKITVGATSCSYDEKIDQSRLTLGIDYLF